jgi:hypothetical protein
MTYVDIPALERAHERSREHRVGTEVTLLVNSVASISQLGETDRALLLLDLPILWEAAQRLNALVSSLHAEREAGIAPQQAAE